MRSLCLALGLCASPEEEQMSNHIMERRTPTAAEREARKVFRDASAKVALSEY